MWQQNDLSIGSLLKYYLTAHAVAHYLTFPHIAVCPFKLVILPFRVPERVSEA